MNLVMKVLKIELNSYNRNGSLLDKWFILFQSENPNFDSVSCNIFQ